ncbi:MAG: T9SS type A sorting domain-containing protein, partial [Candidatus Margulisbacteria bacterium]|nr:T9SS type A sorting domain-containing protein [Candidatus Margulisiibacteriota bacterium]
AAIYTPLLPASTDVLDITLSGISATSIVYPSPFNSTESSVTIAYRHTVDETIKIYIADISGRIVKTITTNSGTTRSADGYSRETWAGDSAFGGTVPSGVYVVQITAGGKVVTKTKVIVLR